MASFLEARLTDGLDAALARFEQKVQSEVLLSGVAAAANVIYDEVKLNVQPPRLGRFTGNLDRSIYRAYSPEKSTATSKVYRISWNRKIAPHGHLIEFGTSRAPAYPFLRPALSRLTEAFKAANDRMKERLEGPL